MSNLARLQQQFVAFLQGQPSEFSKLVSKQAPVPTRTRLGIYQNAYHMRLRETIDNDHPVLGAYLGDELYDLLVRKYIGLYPSKVKSLRYFCDGIPQLLAEVKPFSSHLILSSLAAFERILLSAFDAKDQDVITIEKLASLPPEQWPVMNLMFHPSVRIFQEQINAVETWQALKGEIKPPAPLKREYPVFWLVWRNQERLTEFRHVSAPEYVLFNHFQQGGDFGSGCELLSEYFNVDDVPVKAVQFLQMWINSGLIVGIPQ